MISMPQRAEVRHKTLESLAQCSIYPKVFVSPSTKPNSELRQAAMAANVWEALRHGVASKREYVLYVEDDIVMWGKIVEGLDIVMHEIEADIFFPYSPRGIKSAAPNAPKVGEIYPVWNLRGIEETQCVLLRRELAERLLTYEPQTMAGALRMLSRGTVKAFAMRPNLIKHREGVSTWRRSQ